MVYDSSSTDQSRQFIGKDGGQFALPLVNGHHYSISAADEPCQSSPAAFAIVANNVRGQSITHTFGFSELPRSFDFSPSRHEVPFFVTGYWYPNTATNFSKYKSRVAAGELKSASFVDRRHIDEYAKESDVVESLMRDSVLHPLMSLVSQMSDAHCRTADSSILISVVGFCDKDPLRNGAYVDKTVKVENQTISNGSVLNKTDPTYENRHLKGNLSLSRLRAFYTAEHIDSELRRLCGNQYDALRKAQRIIISCEGGGISDRGKQAQDRRVDVAAKLIPLSEAQAINKDSQFFSSK
jgi:hypothetical protein